MSTTIRLRGLDAQDPLAYLASLGCLLALSDRCRRAKLGEPRMYFDLRGVPTPIVEGPLADADALLDLLVEDLDVIAGRAERAVRDAFLTFRLEGLNRARSA